MQSARKCCERDWEQYSKNLLHAKEILSAKAYFELYFRGLFLKSITNDLADIE